MYFYSRLFAVKPSTEEGWEKIYRTARSLAHSTPHMPRECYILGSYADDMRELAALQEMLKEHEND